MSATATRQEGIEVYETPITLTTIKAAVTSITDSTKTVTAAESGTIFTLNRAAGITVTLPAATAGLTYEFHVGTTFTGTMQIDAASSPAAADHQIVADGDTKGRFIGGMIKYTCITDSKWVVTGYLFGDGTAATPFT
jgi:hypothetical protein